MSKHTHSTLTDTHTDTHSDTDTRRHTTRGRPDSLSPPFFCFLYFSVFPISCESSFLVICIGVWRRGEKTRRRSSLVGRKKSSQVPCVLPLLFQTTITDNFLRFSKIVPVVLWPTVRICCQLARIESRANLTSRNNNGNDGKKGTFSGAAAGAGAAAGGI
jgi:hypothetical protein